jgi:hypothetical protein
LTLEHVSHEFNAAHQEKAAWCSQAIGVPGSLVRFGLALVDSSLRLTGAVLNGVGSMVLPGFLMNRLRGAFPRSDAL